MHTEERQLIDVLRAEPDNVEPCLVYEDWLEDRDEPRSRALKLLRAIAGLNPDHASWPILEEQLGTLRPSMDADWLFQMTELLVRPTRGCDCDVHGAWKPTELHRNVQDTSCDAWKRLVEIVEIARGNVTLRFSPMGSIPPDERKDIVTLPKTIGLIEDLVGIDLYGSSLVRVPPELARLVDLREFVPYRSHSLHWYPYELTSCESLAETTVSTRALYGNEKNHAPFPKLTPPRIVPSIAPASRPCGVCGETYEDRGTHRRWISRRVGTDVLPLLVNACSDACLEDA